MKSRMMFMAGAAVGYVLGTKAGRERYEQIKRLSRQVSANPNVQEAAGMLRAKGGQFAGAARGKAGEMASTAKEKVPQQKVAGRHKAEDEPTVHPG
ncbi:YtxH domain-containing protein [Actinomadura physcomitrii]|uniref:YtxH domain-containing protein n=1 Tax=Actinomadura physcomitrii TaxID=2650748 RepID=UPI00192431F6|nr:YtxH domain-containing protein [Actinomadura physcomitrii]